MSYKQPTHICRASLNDIIIPHNTIETPIKRVRRSRSLTSFDILTFSMKNDSESHKETPHKKQKMKDEKMSKLTTEQLAFAPRQPYRLGSQKLLPLPLQTLRSNAVRAQLPDSRSIMERLKGILNAEGLLDKLLWADVVDRRPKEGVLKTNFEGKLTILFVVDLVTDAITMASWHGAISRMSSILKELHISVPLEIIDFQADDGLFTSPILSTESNAIQAWKRMRGKVLEQLYGTQWSSIDIVHRALRPHLGRGAPTVLITAKDAHQSIWSSVVLPQLRQLLGDLFAVELLWGDVRNSGDHCTVQSDEDGSTPLRHIQTVQDPRIAMDAFTKHIEMGASIGRAGHKGSRTAGGLIQLDWNGQLLDLVVTNQQNAGLSGRAALSPSHDLVTHEALVVVSPSDGDKADMEAWLTYKAKQKNAILEDEQLKADVLLGIQYRKRNLEQAITKASQIAKDLERIAHFDSTLGHVFATSGFGIRENDRYDTDITKRWSQKTSEPNNDLLGWDVDWCLVKPSSDRSISPMVEDITHGVKVAAGATASAWASIDTDSDYNVVKIGRSTRWTTGIISAIESVVACRTETPHGKHTLCHAVHHTHNKDFGWSGDSGSLILLDQADDEKVPGEAQIVGLLVGDNRYTKLCYMAPIDLIIDDIERVTGGKVVFPRKREVKAKVKAKVTTEGTAELRDQKVGSRGERYEEGEQSSALWEEWI